MSDDSINQDTASNVLQKQYKDLIRTMNAENYRQFRSQEFLKILKEYFLFLERELTGDDESKYVDADFGIEELVNVNADLEVALVEMRPNQKRAAELIGRLSS